MTPLLVGLVISAALLVFTLQVVAVRGLAAQTFLATCCLFMLWMICITLLTMSPVVISSSAITKRLFGIPIREIRWTDVVAAHKLRQQQLYGFGSRTYSDSYTIHRRGWGLIDAFVPNLVSSITFNDQFADLRALLDTINAQSRKNAFPLLSTDFELRAKAPSTKWFRVSVEEF
jgi:hypothetical protein